MVNPVELVDFDAIYDRIVKRRKDEERARRSPPKVDIYDGDWNLRGTVKKAYLGKFTDADNEGGVGVLELPEDYYMSEWLAAVHERKTTNVHVIVEKDGVRWGGRLEELLVIREEGGRSLVRCIFQHDKAELEHILAYSNPFLLPEIQFPRLWAIWGRARWVCKTTLLLNLRRLENSSWSVPDNPLDPGAWGNIPTSRWSQVVKPDLEPDRSVTAMVVSRFKTIKDATKHVVADAQLSWECRRHLNGDPPPWPGAQVRHGALVWDLVDKSGWTTGTSFGGNIFGGLLHELIKIGSDGLTQTNEVLRDPNIPEAALKPGWKGSDASMPGVIYRRGKHSGIQSSEFSWKPATDVGVVSGGHSMPGVNELISAAVQALGDLTAMIPGVPPLGGAADAILAPLYTDVFMAFGKWKNPARAQRLGWSHYHEKWADGADSAYTLAWVLAQRRGMWETRECTRHTLTIADGAQGWFVGQRGHGHYYVGDRIGSIPGGCYGEGLVFVDRVSEVTLSWERGKPARWTVVIGEREPFDPIAKAFEKLQDFLGMLKDLGVL